MMGQPKQIEFGTKYSGIQITYIKSKKILHFFGWYDGNTGIEGGELSLDDFCKQLGIEQV